MKKAIALIISFIFLLCLPLAVFAQESPSPAKEEILEAKVVKILKESLTTQDKKQFLAQELELLVTKGSLADQKIIVEVGNIPIVGQAKYKVGDKVLVSYSQDFEDEDIFFITDYIRQTPLLVLLLIFVILTLIVGHWRGASSLLGLGISFLIIFAFILPQIYTGKEPVFIAIAGSGLIIPATFYLSHGLNRKTTIAILGTLIALVITGILAKVFVEAGKLTGYASEEASFLQVAKPGVINIKGLVLAGIIIGTLGILDDITIAQAAVVEQLKKLVQK